MTIHPKKVYKMSSESSMYANKYVFIVEITSTYVKIDDIVDSYYSREYFENHAKEVSKVETLLFAGMP